MTIRLWMILVIWRKSDVPAAIVPALKTTGQSRATAETALRTTSWNTVLEDISLITLVPTL